MNLEGARLVCNQIGVDDKQFYQAISTFKGAARRLELVVKNDYVTIFKDFAHSPSKLKATTQAVKEQFGNRKVIACMELHTFSSLNANFLDEYASAMDAADTAIVFFNPHTIAHKKLAAISADQVKHAFKRSDLMVFDDSKILENYLKNLNFKNEVLLMMTSGTFDGMDLKSLAN
jgi:UDP-N-acetylmuramate: L-alanyl-gamma-D-glutamyl-meso-diaminopimelate ligase